MKELLFRDDLAVVYPYPRTVKVMLEMRDTVTLIEEVNEARESDVLLAYRKAMLYRYKTGVWPRIVIKASRAEEEAVKLAKELGVEIEFSNGDSD